MEKLLIWVDENDHEIGYGEKMETHRSGQLHRAYSVFIYDRYAKKMLLQKRASSKYHSGGYWSNACCSHPYQGETWVQAIQRGIQNELGISLEVGSDAQLFAKDPDIQTDLRFLGSFQYYSNYGDLSEHELDHVFLYLPDERQIAQIMPNLEEIEELMWLPISVIEYWLLTEPDIFTSWFQKAYQFTKKYVCN